MPLYKYRCEKGHTTLQRRSTEIRNINAECRECGDTARRDMLSESKAGHSFDRYVDYNLKEDPVLVKNSRQKKRLKKEEGVREKGSYVD